MSILLYVYYNLKKMCFISLIKYGSQLGQNVVGLISKENKVISKKKGEGTKDKCLAQIEYLVF